VLAHTTWPGVMLGSLALTGALLAAGVSAPTTVAALTIGNFFVLAVLEQLMPRLPGSNLLRDRQSLRDAAHGALFTFVGRPLASGLALVLVALAGVTWQGARAASAWPVGAPLLAQVGLALAIWSLGNYGLHRAMHSFDFLWWFHSIHHDTPQMHVLKSGRIHVVDEMIQFLVLPLPLFALGAPTEVLVWLGLWTVFEGNLAHSNLDQRFPSFAHYLVQTPQVHAVHHAQDRRLQDSNYTGPCALWDLAFGTFRHPDRHPVVSLGIADSPVPPGFVAQLAFPFRRSAR
jgi:sterol desaturase/sphingolipid hydroxylase (fatty acid hydroxylase superfamily)